jgi:hypothetical protein
MSNSITITADTIVFSDGTNTRTVSLDAANNAVGFGTAAVSGGSFQAGAGTGIGTFTITESGEGFGVGDEEDFFNKSSSGSGATFTVTSVDASDGITGLTITSSGSGYAVNDVLYCGPEQDGGGTRPEIRVDSLA